MFNNLPVSSYSFTCNRCISTGPKYLRVSVTIIDSLLMIIFLYPFPCIEILAKIFGGNPFCSNAVTKLSFTLLLKSSTAKYKYFTGLQSTGFSLI